MPVRTTAEPGLRVTLLGGAPGPEVKFWRRWASDAGLKPVVRVALGAGLALGDPTPPLTVGGLSRIDLLILDERSWAALGGGERAAVAAAVRGGMGLLLRVTGPVPPGYGAVMGLPLAGGAASAPVRLLDRDGKALPILTRRVVQVGARDAQTLLADATGPCWPVGVRWGAGGSAHGSSPMPQAWSAPGMAKHMARYGPAWSARWHGRVRRAHPGSTRWRIGANAPPYATCWRGYAGAAGRAGPAAVARSRHARMCRLLAAGRRLARPAPG
ncbi:hypothetical protein P0F65_14030 [Sphingomonas sp. I4]